MRRFAAVLSAFVLLTTVLAGCGGSSPASKAPASENKSQPSANSTPADDWGTAAKPIKVAIARLGVYMGGYRLKEVLAKEGIHLELVEFPTTPPRLQALVTKNVDLALAGWTDTLKLVSDGVSLVVLADAAHKGSAVVYRKDSGIKSPLDWKGKKIAVSKGTHQELTALWYMKENKMEATSVDLVHMNFADMPTALARKDIDGFIGSEPYPSISVATGAGEIAENHYVHVPWGDLNVALISRPDIVQAHEAVLRKVIAAFAKAEKDLQANRPDTKAAAIKDFKVPSDAADLTLDNLTFTTEIDLKKVQGLVDTEIALGYIKTKPDLSKLVDTRFTEGQ